MPPTTVMPAVASDGSGVPVPVVDGTELTWSGPIASGETVTITYSVTVTNAGDDDLVHRERTVPGRHRLP